MSPLQYMELALIEATKALNLGEVPIGAVLVSPAGDICYGYNCPISSHDPTAHAEAIAIRQMAKKLGNYRLIDCTLYVTLQPCLMCIGIIEQARIPIVYYGTQENKYQLPYENLCHFQLKGPVLPQPCKKILSDFFLWRRQQA